MWYASAEHLTPLRATMLDMDEDVVPDLHRVQILVDGESVYDDPACIEGVFASMRQHCENPECTNNHSQHIVQFVMETLTPWPAFQDDADGKS